MTPPRDAAAHLPEALLRHAPPTAHTAPPLRAALLDVLHRPGRLARAALVYDAALAHGLAPVAAEQLACAVEYWHQASLVLDDLPCMDDGRERRGRPCVHRTHGESTTILTALALINRAYALSGLVFAEQDSATRATAQLLIEQTLGATGLVGGQARDLGYHAGMDAPRETGLIAWQKTGALLWLSLGLPALASRPSPGEWRALRRLALYWGLAYQAVDDLRDVLSTRADTGKSVQRDAALHRPNLALALGVTAAQRRVQRLLQQATRTMAGLAASHPRWDYLPAWHERVFAASSAALCAA